METTDSFDRYWEANLAPGHVPSEAYVFFGFIFIFYLLFLYFVNLFISLIPPIHPRPLPPLPFLLLLPFQLFSASRLSPFGADGRFSKIENFIRTKYDGKRWVMEGGIPDPSTLDEDDDDDDNVVSGGTCGCGVAS